MAVAGVNRAGVQGCVPLATGVSYPTGPDPLAAPGWPGPGGGGWGCLTPESWSGKVPPLSTPATRVGVEQDRRAEKTIASFCPL